MFRANVSCFQTWDWENAFAALSVKVNSVLDQHRTNSNVTLSCSLKIYWFFSVAPRGPCSADVPYRCEMWLITCCCTVRWPLYPHRCSIHFKHTYRVLGLDTLGFANRLQLAHLCSSPPTGWDSLGAACACVTRVAVLQRFIPLQCCWVEGAVEPSTDMPPQPGYETALPPFEEYFNFLFWVSP